MIGLELVLATVALRDQLRADTGRANREPREVATSRGGLNSRDHGAQQQAALHCDCAMTRCRVHDLVPEHGGELGFGMQLGQEPAVHRDLAAGQGPRVRNRIVQHHELVRQCAAADGRELRADAAHVRRERRVEGVVAALHLLRRRVLLLPDLDFLIGGDQRELAIAGDGIDRAGGEQRKRGAERGVDVAGFFHGANLCRATAVGQAADEC